MNRADFQKLIGVSSGSEEYLPVACLLKTGNGCAGYYSSLVNNDLEETCVLLNATIVELDGETDSRRRVTDFADFIEDIVATHYSKAVETDVSDDTLHQGSVIPLTAIPFSEISLLYPVAQIARLLKQAVPQHDSDDHQPPTFLDFNNKSIVLRALRTKLW